MQNKHRKDEDSLLKKKQDERELLRKKKVNMQKGSNPTIPPLEVDEEVDNKPAATAPAKKPDQQLKARTQRVNREKQQILRRKLQAVRQSTQGGSSTSDITAGYEPEGETIEEAERKLADRLQRKRELYKKTTKKALEYARREGEAAGHARYRMGSIDREIDGIKAKMNKEEVELDERLGGKGYSRSAYKGSIHPPSRKSSGDWPDSDRGEGNKAKRRAGEKVKAKSPTYLAWVKNKKLKEDKVKGNENVSINPKIGPTCPECAGMIVDEECQNCGKKCASSDVKEGFKTQYGNKGKLSKTDAPGSRHDHTHDVDPRMADHVPNKKVRKSSKKETRANVLKFDMKKEEFVDENRMAAHTAGMSDAQKDAATRKVSKRTVDSAGRRNDAAAFKSRKTGGKANRKYEKEIRKSIPSDKPNRNKTGRGQPVQYRKSADSPESEARFPYGRSKIVQGKGSIKDLKKK